MHAHTSREWLVQSELSSVANAEALAAEVDRWHQSMRSLATSVFNDTRIVRRLSLIHI